MAEKTERLVNVEVSTANMDALIESHIMVSMMEALSEDSEALVETVVRLAMSRKCEVDGHNHDRYNREKTPTMFQCKVEKMVQDAAGSIFEQWLTEHHALIRGAIEKRLGKAPKKFVNDIVKAVVEGLGKNLKVEAKLKFEERDY